MCQTPLVPKQFEPRYLISGGTFETAEASVVLAAIPDMEESGSSLVSS